MCRAVFWLERNVYACALITTSRVKEVLEREKGKNTTGNVISTALPSEEVPRECSTAADDLLEAQTRRALDQFPDSKNMTKQLAGLPPFTFNSIIKFVHKSGKRLSQNSRDYVAMKPFERGVNFFIEGYVHNVLVLHCAHDGRFFIRASWHRSLRKSETPHRIRLVISTESPYDVLGSSCTWVAGSVGFCNHAIPVMYLVPHYSMGNVKAIPDDVACTSLPQLWHKPRGKQIAAEPLMGMVFKKPRLSCGSSTSTPQETGLSCSLYQAIKATPCESEVAAFKSRVTKINHNYGLSPYMSAGTETVPTKVGPAPLGGFLSYQLAPTESNFSVTHNLDLSKQPAHEAIIIYPQFPISLFPYGFAVTKCQANQQKFYDSLILTSAETAALEKETVTQRNCNEWWTARKYRLTASRFGDIMNRKAAPSVAFLNGIVGRQQMSHPIPTENMPEILRHGIQHQHEAADQYSNYLRHSGHAVQSFPAGFVVNPAFPFLGWSPDGKVIDLTEDEPYGILEIKCPYKNRSVTPKTAYHDKTFHFELRDDFPSLKKNHKYYYQVQGQLGITGTTWCDFVTYTLAGMCIERIYFDEDFFTAMLLKLESFFFQHCVKHIIQQPSVNECS